MKLGQCKVTLWLEQSSQNSRERWLSMKSRGLVPVYLWSAALFFLSVLVYTVIEPVTTNYIITKLKQLRNDSDMLAVWLRPPVPLLTSVYVWNLTNAEDVSAGRSAPVFKQAGPYVYEQSTEKIPAEYKDHSIVYFRRTRYSYRADLTHPASEDDIVITLNAGLYGSAVLVNSISPSMMPMVNQALPSLFPGVDSLFTPVRVGSYLFDGLVLNCSNNNGTLAAMICKMIPSYAPPMIRRKENSPDFLYSFLSHINYTLQGPFEEDRGLNDIHEVGRLLSLHNTSRLGVWEPSSPCDRLRGHDMYTFPPFISPADKLQIFISEICQPVTVQYEGEAELYGLSVFKYILSPDWLASPQNNSDNSCYCLKNNNQLCQYDGIRDVSPCMKAPIVISLPHFYLADDSFRQYALGLSPSSQRHTSVVYIEPKTGTQLVAARRVQFNVPLKRMKGLPMAENLTEGLFPILWVQEVGEVSEGLLGPVRRPLTVRKVVRVVSLALAVLTGAVLVLCLVTRLWCCGRVSPNQVTALFYRRGHSQSQENGQAPRSEGADN